MSESIKVCCEVGHTCQNLGKACCHGVLNLKDRELCKHYEPIEYEQGLEKYYSDEPEQFFHLVLEKIKSLFKGRQSILLFLFFALFMCGSVSADLIIVPNPIDVKVKVDTVNWFNLSLKNTFDFPIMDFEFSNITGFTIPSDIVLGANGSENSTLDLNFSVKRTDIGMYEILSEVRFKYVVELPQEISTHNINISDEGFKPAFLVIRKGDTVIWKNNDDVSHTVTNPDFNRILAPNESLSVSFDTEGDIDYQDLILFWAGSIEVVGTTSQEKVNNPAYDEIWRINLEITLEPTTLNISLEENNYTLEIDDSIEGLMKVINTGNITAERILLESNLPWIDFDENNFDLRAGETNFVTYTLTPAIFETEETNKTYNLSIVMSASNAPPINISLTVHVPFSDIYEDLNSDEGFLVFFAKYCDEHPTLFICNTSIKTGNSQEEPIVIVRDNTIPINLSEREVYALLQRVQRIEDSNARTNNEIKDVANKLDKEIPEIKEITNKSLELTMKYDRISTARSRMFLWVSIFTIICLGISGIGYAIYRHNRKRAEMDGGLEPSYWG